MKKFTISFNEFKKHIEAIKNFNMVQDGIDDAIRLYMKNSKDDAEIQLPTLEDNMVSLLEHITEDDGEWICYWLYELHFGDKYKDGMITDANGKNIKLETVEDLWNVLSADE